MKPTLAQLMKAYSEGRSAYREGERRAHNPYAAEGNATLSAEWWDGFDDEAKARPRDEEETDK